MKVRVISEYRMAETEGTTLHEIIETHDIDERECDSDFFGAIMNRATSAAAVKHGWAVQNVTSFYVRWTRVDQVEGEAMYGRFTNLGDWLALDSAERDAWQTLALLRAAKEV